MSVAGPMAWLMKGRPVGSLQELCYQHLQICQSVQKLNYSIIKIIWGKFDFLLNTSLSIVKHILFDLELAHVPFFTFKYQNSGFNFFQFLKSSIATTDLAILRVI